MTKEEPKTQDPVILDPPGFVVLQKADRPEKFHRISSLKPAFHLVFPL
jgi:hypothetical protein